MQEIHGEGRTIASLRERRDLSVQNYEAIEDILINPKYIWKIPGPHRLKPGDLNYEWYVCRTGVIGSIPTNIELILKRSHDKFAPKQNQRLMQIKERMLTIIRNDDPDHDENNFRTEGEMLELRKLTEEAVVILQSRLLSKAEQELLAA